MKGYLWTAVAVLFVSASASENPFALKENLLKIDNDQDNLLSELSKIAETRAASKLVVKKQVKIEPAKESQEVSVKMKDSVEQYNLTNSIAELLGEDDKQELLEKKETPVEQEVPEKTKTPEKKVRKSKKEEPQKEEAFNLAATIANLVGDEVKENKPSENSTKIDMAKNEREEERKEVAAYEKQRAAKLAKKAQEETINKSVKIDQKSEKKAAKESADESYKSAVKVMGGEEVVSTPKKIVKNVKPVKVEAGKQDVAGSNIDVEAEKMAAIKAADAVYLEAVREMEKEN